MTGVEKPASIRGPAYFLAQAVKARTKDLKNEGKTLDQVIGEISVELYRAGRGERDVPLAEVRVPTHPGTLGPAEKAPQQTLGSLGVRAVLVLALEKVCPDVVTHLISSGMHGIHDREEALAELRKIIVSWVYEEYGAG